MRAKKDRDRKDVFDEGDLLHLDVTDGSFASHKTWADPLEWVKLKSPFGLEVHLMVDHPEEYADNWLAAGARRLIVHMESLTAQSLHEIICARGAIPRGGHAFIKAGIRSRRKLSRI